MRLVRWIVLAIVVWVPLQGTLAQERPSRPVRPAAAPTQPKQQAVPVIDPDLMGMVIRDPWFEFDTNPAYPNQPNKAFQDRMGAVLAQAGVRWVRMDFRLAAPISEPVTSTLVQNEIAKNDYFINVVAPRHGFKVLGLLAFDLLQGTDANDLNGNTPEDFIESKYGGGVNQYMQAWLDRALAIADRYGDRIAAYQVLNEQNRLPRYTPDGPVANAIEPSIVGRLVTKLYRFCRGIEVPPNEPVHGCREAQIILGGLHPRGTGEEYPIPDDKTDAAYLKAIYADPGSFGTFYERYGRWPVDRIGYHPYPEEIRLSLQEKNMYVDMGVQRIRQALVEAGDPCVPTWITEVGYNVGFDVDGPRGPIPQQTEAGQAAFLTDVYTSLAARTICGGQREIAHIFWFKYEDFPPADDEYDQKGRLINAAQRWGIVRIPFRTPAQGENCPGGACYDVNGTPALYRLSYYAYRELAGLPVQRIYAPVVQR